MAKTKSKDSTPTPQSTNVDIPNINVNTYDDVINDDYIESAYSGSESNTNNSTETDVDIDNIDTTDTQTTKTIEDKPAETMPTTAPVSTPTTAVESDKLRLSDFDDIINQSKKEEENEKRNEEKTADVQKGTDAETQKVSQQRDYSIFNTEEQSLFKGTSNEVYEYLKSTLPKLRDLEKQYQELQQKQSTQQQTENKPTTIYDHPDSYVLSDEYRNNAYKAQLYDFEERHWTEQLQRLRNSETKLLDLVGYDDKGNPKYAEIEIKPEMVSKAEVQLIKNIQSATSAKQNTINDINKYAEEHKKNYTGAVSSIKDMENKYLSMYNEKSHRAKDIQTFINNIPPAFHSNPLLSPMSKMYAMILDLIDIAKKNKTNTAHVDDIKKKTQPTSSALRPGGNTNEILYSPDEYEDEI